ncbi:MAG: transglycosylase SLT domain-containing protein [Bacteroidetes bacterium]|nr:transglycosylase SLT domain-containing protein [Bacteroidota bacterium]
MRASWLRPVFLFVCLPTLLCGQSDDLVQWAPRTADRLDSLLDNFYFKKEIRLSRQQRDALNTYGFAEDEIPNYHPRVYEQRLKELCTVIPLDYNPIVHAFIELYVIKRRSTVARLLGRQHAFFPYIEEVLMREGLPVELKYVAVIESALTTRARSWAAAVGLWQFIHGTARLYNIRMDSYVDERQDPVKSTELAVAHFKDLYAIYHDWLLVIAAYNCGPGNVNRAIRLSGGKTSFWEIKRYLPAETAAYVPLFIAATYSMNYAAEHNIYPIYTDLEYPRHYINIVNVRVTLAKIAEVLHLDPEYLAEINPELKVGIIPFSSTPYKLRVPKAAADKVLGDPIAFYDAIRTDKNPMIYPVNEQALRMANVEGEPRHYTPIPPNAVSHYYQLKNRETLAYVAQKYGVTVEAIADWNQMWGYTPRAGEWVKLYLTEDAILRAEQEINVPENTQAQAPPPSLKTTDLVPDRVEPVNSGAYTRPVPPVSQPGTLPKYHIVSSGDTLWKIAQMYQHGLTISKLAQLNGIQQNAPLHVGQQIRLF